MLCVCMAWTILEVQPCGPTVAVKVSTLFCCIEMSKSSHQDFWVETGSNSRPSASHLAPGSSRSPTARRPRVDAAKFALCIAWHSFPSDCLHGLHGLSRPTYFTRTSTFPAKCMKTIRYVSAWCTTYQRSISINILQWKITCNTALVKLLWLCYSMTIHLSLKRLNNNYAVINKIYKCSQNFTILMCMNNYYYWCLPTTAKLILSKIIKTEKVVDDRVPIFYREIPLKT